MKEILKLIILSCLFGCQGSPNQITEQVVKSVTRKDSVQIDIKSINNTEKQIPIESLENYFIIDELTKDFCLVAGAAKYDLSGKSKEIKTDSLKGYIKRSHQDNHLIGLHQLQAQRRYIDPKVDSLPICETDKTLIIPFSLPHENKIYLTTWNKVEKDSIIFSQMIYPSIERQYSLLADIKIYDRSDEKYLVLYFKGGEGGSNWDEVIIADYDGNVKFEKIDSAFVGHCHDCGDWAKIEVRTNSLGFELIEIRDSMTLKKNDWIREQRTIKMLKTVKY